MVTCDYEAGDTAIIALAGHLRRGHGNGTCTMHCNMLSGLCIFQSDWPHDFTPAGVSGGMLVVVHRTNGGKKPQAIVYYRDGVAQGQFEQVLQEEYNAIRRVSKRGAECSM